jgi:hypothetical protein
VTIQLTSGDLGSPSISTIPNNPFGGTWGSEEDPEAVAVGTCKNTGYTVDNRFQFLVEIDLATLQNNPANISTPLPTGACAGIFTTSACTNGNGVKFLSIAPKSEIGRVVSLGWSECQCKAWI